MSNFCHLSCCTSVLEEAEMQFDFSGLYLVDTRRKELFMVYLMFIHNCSFSSNKSYTPCAMKFAGSFLQTTFLIFNQQKALCDAAQAVLWNSFPICCLATNNCRMLIWYKQSRITVTVSKLNITAVDNGELPDLSG